MAEKQWSQEDLKELTARKEEEWKQAQQLRAEALEAALNVKEQALTELKSQFLKLKEDFKYNLRLLNERDTELSRYDSMFTDLKSQLAKKDMEISDLKIKLDNAHVTVEQEAKTREELQGHYQQRLRQKQAEMEKYRCSKDADVEKERHELESYKRNFDRQLRELEEELELQRRELTAGFEDAMRKREHEYRTQVDEMSATVLAHEMKTKLLSKEHELLKKAQETTAQDFQQVEGNHRELEKQLRQKDWEKEDLRAMKDAKIQELEAKMKQAESSLKKVQENFQQKYAEMDRATKDKDLTISKLRDGAQNRECHLQEQLHTSEAQVDDLQVKLRQAQWNIQDVQKEKESLGERLGAELSDIKHRWDTHVADMSRTNVQRDLELETLRADNCQLKSDMIQRKDDIERYKKELCIALEREAGLERARAQLEIDWQSRYDSVERQQYEKVEDLMKSLTQARDQAQADLKEKTREADHQGVMISLLKRERDEAFAVLKQYGLQLDVTSLTKCQTQSDSHPENFQALEDQNENLRQVIRHMRQEMETLGDSSVFNRSTRGPSSVANEYVCTLEEDLQKLKAHNRKLNQQVADLEGSKVKVKDTPAVDPNQGPAGESSFVKAHVEQLNNTIGALRSEKVDLMAQLRKHQARIQHLENGLETALKQPREQQALVDQLQYEVNAGKRRHGVEASSLKGRISELELQVNEGCKEADEYHRANIERNLEVTNLTNQLSQLKMQIAEGRPAVNFGAQELMIQQLQDEIQHLRQIQKGEEPIMEIDPKLGQGQGLTTNAMVAQLKYKLKTAAKHITQLAREKQQLIEMGNRLRAQLKNYEIESEPTATLPHHSKDITASVLQEKIHSKLQQLENLQYTLTKQELARQQPKISGSSLHHPNVPRIQLASSMDTEDEDGNFHPQSILKKPSAPTNQGTQSNLSPLPEDLVHHSRPRSVPEQHNQPDHIPVRIKSQQVPTHRTSSPLRDNPTAGLLASVSSVGGESLQEVWKMLDEDGTSPRPFTPMASGDHGSGPFNGLQFPGDLDQDQQKSSESWSVAGKKKNLEAKPKAPTKKIAGKVFGKSKQAQKVKVRNWNVTDDDRQIR